MRSLVSLVSLARYGVVLAAVLFVGLPVGASARHMVFPLSDSPAGYVHTPFTVNDTVEVQAIIDTAATIAMIDASVAARSGINAPSTDEIKMPVHGLLGVREFPVVSIGNLASEGVRIFDVRAAYNNREQMPGGPLVIPATSFGGDVLDFDFPAGRLSIYEGRPQSNARSSGKGRPSMRRPTSRSCSGNAATGRQRELTSAKRPSVRSPRASKRASAKPSSSTSGGRPDGTRRSPAPSA